MSILSGFLKTKKYRNTSEGYKLQSEWTSSETVEMGDGNTLEANLGEIKGITSSLTADNSGYALSASAGKDLQDQIHTVNTDLQDQIHTAFYETKEFTVTLQGIPSSSYIQNLSNVIAVCQFGPNVYRSLSYDLVNKLQYAMISNVHDIVDSGSTISYLLAPLMYIEHAESSSANTCTYTGLICGECPADALYGVSELAVGDDIYLLGEYYYGSNFTTAGNIAMSIYGISNLKKDILFSNTTISSTLTKALIYVGKKISSDSIYLSKTHPAFYKNGAVGNYYYPNFVYPFIPDFRRGQTGSAGTPGLVPALPAENTGMCLTSGGWALPNTFSKNETDAFSWYGAGFLTGSNKTLRFSIPVSKSMANISTIAISGIRIYVRQSNVYLLGSSSEPQSLTESEYTVTSTKGNDRMVNITLSFPDSLGGTNNDTVGIHIAATFTFS